jgi:hypothetical protein
MGYHDRRHGDRDRLHALSGRLILGREKDARDAFSAIDAQVQSLEDKISPSAKLPIDQPPSMNVVSLCHFTQRKPVVEATARVKLASLPGAPGDLAQGYPTRTPTTNPARSQNTRQHICPHCRRIFARSVTRSYGPCSWSRARAADSVVTQASSSWDWGATHTRCISLFRWRRFSAWSLRI